MARTPKGQSTGAKKKIFVGFRVDPEVAAEIDRRADSLYLSRNQYAERALVEWLASGKKIVLQEK